MGSFIFIAVVVISFLLVAIFTYGIKVFEPNWMKILMVFYFTSFLTFFLTEIFDIEVHFNFQERPNEETIIISLIAGILSGVILVLYTMKYYGKWFLLRNKSKEYEEVEQKESY